MAFSTDSMLELEDKWPRRLVTHTTLYDLIAAINTEVGVEEDDLVIACVLYLLKTQRLTYRQAFEPRRSVTARRLTPRRRRIANATGFGRKSHFRALGAPSSRPDAPAGPRRLPALGGP
jgi:hypothetical protein